MSRPPPNHSKRLGREFAMQFLYPRELAGEAAEPDDLEHFWEQVGESAVIPESRDLRRARKYAESLIQGVTAEQAELDRQIAAHATPAWPLNRMAAVDRNLLRVAVYEMLRCPGVPPVVSINEAIEIAKEFSGDESGAFINGILNSIMATLDRPTRVAMRPPPPAKPEGPSA
jgi:N utilization substance protein B